MNDPPRVTPPASALQRGREEILHRRFRAAVEILDSALEGPEGDASPLRAELLVERATARRELGETEGAEGDAIRALEALDSDAPPALRDRIRSTLGRIHYAAGRYAAAREVEAPLQEEAPGRTPESLHAFRLNHAATLWKLGETEAARALEESIVVAAKSTWGERSRHTLTARVNLLFTRVTSGELDPVEEELPALRKDVDEVFEPGDPTRLSLQDLEVQVAEDRGDRERALELRRELYETYGRAYGADHFNTIGAGALLARRELDAGEPERALPLVRRAWEHGGRHRGELDTGTLRHLAPLCRALVGTGRRDEALGLARRLDADLDRLPEADPDGRLEVLWTLGAILDGDAETEELDSVLRRTIEVSRSHRGEDDVETQVTRCNLGGLLFSTGAIEEAVALYRTAYAARARTFGEGSPEAWETLLVLGIRLEGAEEDQAAALVLDDGLAAATKAGGLDRGIAQTAADSRARLLYGEGAVEAAVRLHAAALEALDGAARPSRPPLQARVDRARAWFRIGERDAATRLLRGVDEVALASDPPGRDLEADDRAWALECLGAGRVDTDPEAALALLRRALEIRVATAGLGHFGTLNAMSNVASVASVTGAHREAAMLAGAAFESLSHADLAEEPTQVGLTRVASGRILGTVLIRAGLRVESLDVLRRTLGWIHELPEHLQGGDLPVVRDLVERLEGVVRSEGGEFDRWWTEFRDEESN